jgi:quinol monooxygenase YgiN
MTKTHAAAVTPTCPGGSGGGVGLADRAGPGAAARARRPGWYTGRPWEVASVSTTTVGLFVRLEAKPGREGDVETFLTSAVPLVQAEPATTAWFAVRLGPSSFAIFDAFPSEDGRAAHLQGRVAAALMDRAAELLARAPSIERLDVLADKLPG